MNYFSDKKILLTGGAGFLGQYVFRELIKNGAIKENITIPRSKNCDLSNLHNARKAVKGKDIVIHLAGLVGGIGFNKLNPARMIYENLLLALNIFEQSRLAGVKKLVTLGSVCCYPKYSPIPFKEKNLWDGYPEETNAPFGLAKKMMLVLSQAYRQQYNFNSLFLLSVNLYGPGDNFNPQSSHVIPALITKIYQAKKNKEPSIKVWGTGKASREFFYVADCAKAIVLATKLYNKSDPVNLGNGQEITIKKLIVVIAELMNYRGKIMWERDKPDGQPKRCLDVSRAYKEFGFKAKTDLITGLKKTIKWYLKQQSE